MHSVAPLEEAMGQGHPSPACALHTDAPSLPRSTPLLSDVMYVVEAAESLVASLAALCKAPTTGSSHDKARGDGRGRQHERESQEQPEAGKQKAGMGKRGQGASGDGGPAIKQEGGSTWEAGKAGGQEGPEQRDVEASREVGGSGPRVLMAHGRNRFAESVFMQAARPHFDITELGQDQLHPDYVTDDVSVYVLVPKQG